MVDQRYMSDTSQKIRNRSARVAERRRNTDQPLGVMKAGCPNVEFAPPKSYAG
jgi:hypothetical protein